MLAAVNSDLSQQLFGLCQTGGVVVDTTTQIMHFEQGRIHRVYLVQTGNEKYILQCLNPQVIGEPLALEQLINSVLAPASLTPQLLPWPATDECVLKADRGHWIRRPYIEGKTLTHHLSLSLFKAMANTLRHFHQALRIQEFDQMRFTGVNPWSDKANVALQARLATDATMICAERKVVDKWKRCKQATTAAGADTYYPHVVVHRDAKPSNFIQRPDSSLVLIDFDTIGTGDPAMDLGEILRAWLSSDESDIETDSIPFDSFNDSLDSFPDTRILGINSTECASALMALATGYNDSTMTTSRIRWAAMRCCLRQCERFLEDHLAGDPYYAVHTHGDNLLRAEQQLDAWNILDETKGPIESLNS